jgi:integrase
MFPAWLGPVIVASLLSFLAALFLARRTRLFQSKVKQEDRADSEKSLSVIETARRLDTAAIDTGCRLGELLKLTCGDIDFESGLITIQAFNTKTAQLNEFNQV